MRLRNLFVTSLIALSAGLPCFAISEKLPKGGMVDTPPANIYIDNETYAKYKKITKDERLIQAIETMKGGLSDYSRRAILGENLSGRPIKVEFRNLAELNPVYADFDALGWKNKNQLYIFINQKHKDAPKEALAAVLTHEAIHQDELNSLNEETYCWTIEAAVWTNFTERNPELEDIMHPLVDRENTIKRLFVKGNYTSKYIRKSVISNAGYQTLPSRSPGFEDENL